MGKVEEWARVDVDQVEGQTDGLLRLNLPLIETKPVERFVFGVNGIELVGVKRLRDRAELIEGQAVRIDTGMPATVTKFQVEAGPAPGTPIDDDFDQGSQQYILAWCARPGSAVLTDREHCRLDPGDLFDKHDRIRWGAFAGCGNQTEAAQFVAEQEAACFERLGLRTSDNSQSEQKNQPDGTPSSKSRDRP